MKLNQLKNPQKKARKRVGRGISAGGGKTAGRGTKGQKSRSGHHKLPAGFEGGQMPLKQRLPKLGGFKSRRVKNLPVKLSVLPKYFKNGEVITPEKLLKVGIIKKIEPRQRVKILFDKEVKERFSTKDILVSQKASRFVPTASVGATADRSVQGRGRRGRQEPKTPVKGMKTTNRKNKK